VPSIHHLLVHRIAKPNPVSLVLQLADVADTTVQFVVASVALVEGLVRRLWAKQEAVVVMDGKSSSTMFVSNSSHSLSF
jgi:hypothetical protein